MDKRFFFLLFLSTLFFSCGYINSSNPEKFKLPKVVVGTITESNTLYVGGVQTQVRYFFYLENVKRVSSFYSINFRFESIVGRKYNVYYDSKRPKNNYIEISEPILSNNTSQTIGKIKDVEIKKMAKIGDYLEVRYEYKIQQFNFTGVHYFRKSKIDITQEDLKGMNVNVIYENDNPSISMIQLNDTLK